MFTNRKFKEILLDLVTINIEDIEGMKPKMLEKIISILDASIDEAAKDAEEEMELAEKVGPPMWSVAHWIAEVADSEGKPDLYYQLMDIYSRGHPCKDVCRPHTAKNLRILNPTWYDKCADHAFDFHNLVNRQLGKQQYKKSDYKNRYNLKCGSCTFTPEIKGSKTNVVQNQSTVRTGNKAQAGVHPSNRSQSYTKRSL